MNDFTKEELKELLNGYQMHSHNTRHNLPSLDLCRKIQCIIDNYWLPDNVEIIGTGQLLFNDNHSQSSIISKIEKQLAVCENADETKCFRIDWKILYGKKYGQ